MYILLSEVNVLDLYFILPSQELDNLLNNLEFKLLSD
jgi:hypothetical protein